jgi:hypothetical protein|tara:strand:+ start:1631 stop:1765 length:135 start_codon:yes stop_codon:yes gene_type:complete
VGKRFINPAGLGYGQVFSKGTRYAESRTAPQHVAIVLLQGYLVT